MNTVIASVALMPQWTAFIVAAFQRRALRDSLAASRFSLAFSR